MAPITSYLQAAIAAIAGPGYTLKDNAVFDFSEWESVADWSKVVWPAQTKVLITKATDGKEYVDKAYVRNWTAFKLLPYKRGAYHFFEFNDVQPQVDNYCARMLENGWTKDDYPPILDAEVEAPPENKKKPDNLPRGAAYAYQVKTWLDAVEAKLGVRPVIYSSESVINSWRDRNGNLPSWINDYWWWLAWYPDTAYVDLNKVYPPKLIPSGLDPKKIAGWQYRADWRLQGIPFDGVDVSTANPDFLATLSVVPTPIPAPIPTPVPVPSPDYIPSWQVTYADLTHINLEWK